MEQGESRLWARPKGFPIALLVTFGVRTFGVDFFRKN